MIAFDLQCVNGHAFEGWFDDKIAFEDQQKQGLVTCPVCDDSNVFIVPSTFAIPKAVTTLRGLARAAVLPWGMPAQRSWNTWSRTSMTWGPTLPRKP